MAHVQTELQQLITNQLSHLSTSDEVYFTAEDSITVNNQNKKSIHIGHIHGGP